ncbi:alpha-D-ribose 1-methylphosphonate 5-triphosphate diphosphatase [Afifella marina]|uniref:Alpha-D-ribose 1-methylphosphonate 5-triphosphate diphosphatase n=1 Tax=Afifella marina DSM 2698 TaxID=1120955 RepID=A0A1G5MUH5_AFIMA|nr:alpha-D-ribose 1-methylphosphonate 5-triphosphate diphosphatase [Afifella marina]MBK1621994.1 alpha-D-ribose 1-methylphosphonate 5-triphosphate diphosphatase [Afifella marina DSM 2698]MBK1627787.1 alpha-D-ribose 1-methylphosphonate 5-triphosphate diphosphatase [Afifella marina]MBK5916754.1 phosphonate metabolism protein PhnM [Afifella marina]RAI19920.1 phosphonate metabolism protein PhnM [Afifella marina DSM 2698]SCZ28692.1 alpha-D-ribose 1-methylphosphonate 5-triphosphate diphosphatase [Af
MSEVVFRNARMVLADSVEDGDLIVAGETIREIADPGSGSGGVDLEGDWLLPGLVELHTDHLEGHFAPRPGVRWNPAVAVQAHDAQVATSGITTVLDALRVGADEDARVQVQEMRGLADAIEESQDKGRLRAEHFVHLRCEVSASDVMDGFALFENDPRLKLVSLMDHTPGQRQFASFDAYKIYYQGKTGMDDEAFQSFVDRRMAEGGRWSAQHRKLISNLCRERGIRLASHDDATEAHVAEAVEFGVHVAEFPTTVAAARASKEAGMQVLMGAPNIVRGGSHSGNVAAAELAAENLLDVLSSDYVPFSLIQAVFAISEAVEGVDLPQAVAMVSANPAKAVGLDDRGVIAPGKRADFVQVRFDDGVPVVRSVWRQGRRVA